MDSTKTESVTLDDTRVMGARTFTRGRSVSVGAPCRRSDGLYCGLSGGELPPVPEDWKEDHPPRPVAHLLGTGLGMFGFRSFPLVGREDEQDHLWQELEVVQSRAAHSRCGLGGGGRRRKVSPRAVACASRLRGRRDHCPSGAIPHTRCAGPARAPAELSAGVRDSIARAQRRRFESPWGSSASAMTRKSRR